MSIFCLFHSEFDNKSDYRFDATNRSSTLNSRVYDIPNNYVSNSRSGPALCYTHALVTVINTHYYFRHEDVQMTACKAYGRSAENQKN